MNNFFLFFSYSRSAIAITSTVPWPIKDTTTNASQIQETKCIDRSKWAIQEKKRRKRKKKINKKKEEITCFICRGQSYGSLSLSLSLSVCKRVIVCRSVPPPSSWSSVSSYSSRRTTTKKRTTEGVCCTGERIPAEEGPFCPAHPTRGFRRPWSHWTIPWFNDSTSPVVLNRPPSFSQARHA